MTELNYYVTVTGINTDQNTVSTLVNRCLMMVCNTRVSRRGIIEWLEKQKFNLKGCTILSIKVDSCDAATIQPLIWTELFISVTEQETLMYKWNCGPMKPWSELEAAVQAGVLDDHIWDARIDGYDGVLGVVPSASVLNLIKKGVISVRQIEGPEMDVTRTFTPFN